MYRNLNAFHVFLALLLVGLVPMVSSAQTCQSPLPLANHQLHSSNSCSYGTALPMLAGIPLSHPQAIYRLTSSVALNGFIDFSGSSFSGIQGLLLNGCHGGATIIDAFDPLYGSTWTLPQSPLGDYYLMITGEIPR